MNKPSIETIVFDLGGVLIDWNPEYVFAQLFDNQKEMQFFFDHVCTFSWNENQDAGYPLAKATQERVALFPQYRKAIESYYGRWEEMLGGQIEETVAILKRLHRKKEYQLLALTNWSAETFPKAQKIFSFLQLFEGIVVSGEEKTRKPFNKIYRLLLERYELKPEKTLFIDDNLRNIVGAKKNKINTIHFTGAKNLVKQLVDYSIKLD